LQLYGRQMDSNLLQFEILIFFKNLGQNALKHIAVKPLYSENFQFFEQDQDFIDDEDDDEDSSKPADLQTEMRNALENEHTIQRQRMVIGSSISR
jgi:hypothetical protein